MCENALCEYSACIKKYGGSEDEKMLRSKGGNRPRLSLVIRRIPSLKEGKKTSLHVVNQPDLMATSIDIVYHVPQNERWIRSQTKNICPR